MVRLPYSRSAPMLWLSLAIAMLAGTQVPQSASTPTPETEIRTRLSAYEQSVAANRANPEELASIAATVVKQVAASQTPDAVIQACRSEYGPKDADCGPKLWSIAKQQGLSTSQRISAASVLVSRKDPEAAAFLLELAKSVPPVQLARSAELLKGLPAERAVPLLAPLLKSGDAGAAAAGCRALAAIPGQASRQAIGAFLQTAPRGTGQWFACTIAAARLGDPEAGRTTGFITPYLAGEDLLDAGDVLLPADREQGVGLYLQATRESRGLTRLEAADRLVDYKPDVAAELARLALTSNDVQVTAGALELHRHLKGEPSLQVRLFLLAADPIVQLRAAEVILAWDARRRGERR